MAAVVADSKTDAQDLADIFELQKDKLRNQYETVQRGQQQNQQQHSEQPGRRDARKAPAARRAAAAGKRSRARQGRQSEPDGSVGRVGRSGPARSRATDGRASASARASRARAAAISSPTPRADSRMRPTRCVAPRRTDQKGGDATQALNKPAGSAASARSGKVRAFASRDLTDAMRAAQQLADQEKNVQSDVQKLGQSAGDASGAATDDSSPSPSRRARWRTR